MPTFTASDAAAPATRLLRWAHGQAELQALGAMLAPVVFRAPGAPDFAPLHVAPWAEEPGVAEQWPGLMQRLRGEWPCVPFGRTDLPPGLPEGWVPHAPGDTWGHGYASHHVWRWLEAPDALTLALQIDLPADQAVARLTRTVRADPRAPRLEMELTVEARRPCTLPIALHPTLRLDAGRVQLDVPHHGPALSYPVPAEPAGRSLLAHNAIFDGLRAAPLEAGGEVDLSRYPQPHDSEELLQVMALHGPVTAHYLDAGWALTLDWDRELLPDLMLWVSHRGRQHAPWNGRHWALGLEPVNSVFDLGRVAQPPAGHPLASRTGVALSPHAPLVLRASLSAQPAPFAPDPTA